MKEHKDIHKLVRVDQVMQLYARLPVAAVVNVILSTILLFAQRPVINDTLLFAWWGAVVLITALRSLLGFRFRQSAATSIDIETWASRFFAGTVVNGIAWGCAGFLLYPEQGVTHQLVLIFTLAGLTSGALATLGSVWRDVVVFLLAVLIPVILRFLLIGSKIYVGMAAMVLVYLIALLWISRDMHNTILEVLTLRTTDIRHEAKLLESEEKYRNVVERSKDGIGIIQDGRVKFANKPLAGMAGYTVEEITGTPFADYIHPDELPKVADRYRRRMAGENMPTIYETKGLHKDGREVPMELNVGIIPFHNKPAELVIVRDTTDRKQAEEALRESEDRYRALFNHASDYIFIVDPAHEDNPIILDVNEYACAKHGYTREELIGQNFSIINDKDNQEEITDKTMRILAGEILNYESVHVRKDGSKFPVEVSARLIKIKEEPVMIAIVRDITDRKQAEERIKTALLEKELLLKEIHHRVKNNLQIISSFLSLQSGYINDKETREVFRKSQERVRAMAIIHEKLYQSKDLLKIDFSEYIDTLTKYLFVAYSSTPGQIQLKTEIEDISMNLKTAIPLGLIINELVSNSLKHAFPGGKKGVVKVQLKKNKDKNFDFILVISDSGVGLPGDINFRDSGSLGMVLVNTLVKQLRGKVEHQPGKGTRFAVKFKQLEQ